VTREEKNCELLFEYLKSILYDSDTKPFDLEQLDKPYQRLGAGLQLLEKAVKEMLLYSAELSKGNLTGSDPSQDNFLCVNLKYLNANLNQLTWQAKQVASGDYSQNISYPGEFSDSFNAMTRQLKEREQLLKEETNKVEKRAEVIESYNELLMELTRKRNERILVVDAENRSIVYCNKQKSEKQGESACCDHQLSFRGKILNWKEGDPPKWESDDEAGRNYQISSFPVVWRGRNSYAHIIVDITKQKQRTNKLTMKAYRDPGTGISNRLYFEERMERLLEEEEEAVFCYLDLDDLKAVNDHFGHLEGDRYIKTFVSVIQKKFRSGDEFARIGGDEFALILYKCSRELALRKLEEALLEFKAGNSKRYQTGFSYGVVEINGDKKKRSLEEIIRLADEEMYICKRKNKESLRTKDSRI